MDFITAFLNGDLNEEIYMEIPQGLTSSKTEAMVYKLLKSLYGLKQSPRQWYAKIHDYFGKGLEFKTSPNDPCLYTNHTSCTMILIALYVDNLLIVGNSKQGIHPLKDGLSKQYEMKDLRAAKTMLDIEIIRN